MNFAATIMHPCQPTKERVERKTLIIIAMQIPHSTSKLTPLAYGGGHCAMAHPSDPKNKKCINSIWQ